MTDLAVSAHGLGKRYRLGGIETAPAQLVRWARRKEAPGHAWALRELSFDVKEGEAVAVIGHNGAGKSTLLKILARITEPTTGYVDVRGRVGALLEVGTGFSGDLTGRDNVYMNGSILGMTRSEVRRKFDEIVEFSGVGKYIDTPVKWYSSGMYIRLGFAVAAHLEPEVMIVDEVLAVGDAEFQKRCLGRMGEVAREGRTVLFVSHNMQAIRSLCDRAVLLDHGRMIAEGDTHSVVRNYLASVEPLDAGRRRWDDPEARPGDDACRLVEVRVGEMDTAGSTVLSSRPIPVVIELDVLARDPAMVVAFDLVAADGTIVFRSYTTDAGESLGIAATLGRKALHCEIPADLLNAGRYWLNVRVYVRGIDGILNAPSVLHFDVSADHGDSYFMETHHGRPGVLAPILPWELVEPESTAGEMVPPSGAASARG